MYKYHVHMGWLGMIFQGIGLNIIKQLVIMRCSLVIFTIIGIQIVFYRHTDYVFLFRSRVDYFL